MFQEQLDLQAETVPQRPANSPPSYDDAMKNVNEAFQVFNQFSQIDR